jgi:hypothetical protein
VRPAPVHAGPDLSVLTLGELLAHARRAGVALCLVGDRVRYRCPPEAAAVLAELRRRREAVLAVLRGERPEADPPTCPHCSGRTFWRYPGLGEVWYCRRCAPLEYGVRVLWWEADR